MGPWGPLTRPSLLCAVRRRRALWNVATRRVLEKLGLSETGQVERDALEGDNLPAVREL